MLIDFWRMLWDRGFDKKPAAMFELLLVLFLLIAIRRSYTSLVMSEATFLSADLFATQAVGFQPVGWAIWLPRHWVLSLTVQKIVAVVTMSSAIAWLFKRCLPCSSIVCAISLGVLVSLEQSRMFNYTHRFLVSVWVLLVFAMAYTFHFRDIRDAWRNGEFWKRPIYPQWIYWLLVIYMGVQYSASGVIKLAMGGWEAGSGLKLQILIYRANSAFGDLPDLSGLTRIMLEHRWVATLAMTSAVILETGAIVGLSWSRLRPWWALGLVGFHIAVIWTMRIPFYHNVILLVWLALPLYLGDWTRWRPKATSI